MRSLMALDAAQLNALRAKIAELEARPAIERARKQYLLAALRREEKCIRQNNRRLCSGDVIQAA
jgi:hypothetical protein